MLVLISFKTVAFYLWAETPTVKNAAATLISASIPESCQSRLGSLNKLGIAPAPYHKLSDNLPNTLPFPC